VVKILQSDVLTTIGYILILTITLRKWFPFVIQTESEDLIATPMDVDPLEDGQASTGMEMDPGEPEAISLCQLMER